MYHVAVLYNTTLQTSVQVLWAKCLSCKRTNRALLVTDRVSDVQLQITEEEKPPLVSLNKEAFWVYVTELTKSLFVGLAVTRSLLSNISIQERLTYLADKCSTPLWEPGSHSSVSLKQDPLNDRQRDGVSHAGYNITRGAW